MNRRVVLGILAGLILSLAGCNDSNTAPSGPLSVEKLSGTEATAVAGAVLVPTVRVVRGKSAVMDARVRFTVQAGGGTLSASSVNTDKDGKAEVFWLLGPESGAQRLRVQVDDVVEEFELTASASVAGQKYFGRNDYNEYEPGELPIILSVPHDGTLTPNELPDRTGPDADVRDIYALDHARRIASALEELTGQRPHLIANHLRRGKVEPNREVGAGAQGHKLAERAWYEYHNWIDMAKHTVTRDHGKGFYVDLHGHAHEIARNEIGYLLTATDLAHSDDLLNQAAFIDKSSVANLARQDPSQFADLIRGPSSLGDMLVKRGYPSIPSSSDPAPNGTAYFNGGYSTGRHGSRNGGTIDGLQIETPGPGVRNNVALRTASGRAFAEALIEFVELHYGIELTR